MHLLKQLFGNLQSRSTSVLVAYRDICPVSGCGVAVAAAVHDENTKVEAAQPVGIEVHVGAQDPVRPSDGEGGHRHVFQFGLERL